MQREDWWSCADPLTMLDFLRGRATYRKLILFASASVREVRPLLTDERLRSYVQLVESWTDGATSRETLNTAWQRIADRSAPDAIPEDLLRLLGGITFDCQDEPPWFGHDSWAVRHVRAVAQGIVQRSADEEVQKRRLADFLRCLFPWSRRYLFGFWPPLASATLTWNDRVVRNLAQRIHEEQAFERLPILADALEEASGEQDELVQHCRSQGPHVRGCWAIDAILNRE